MAKTSTCSWWQFQKYCRCGWWGIKSIFSPPPIQYNRLFFIVLSIPEFVYTNIHKGPTHPSNSMELSLVNGLVWVMVFNATFNNISVVSLLSVLLVEETAVHGENLWPAVSHWQTLSHNVVSRTPHLSGVWTLVVITLVE